MKSKISNLGRLLFTVLFLLTTIGSITSCSFLNTNSKKNAKHFNCKRQLADFYPLIINYYNGPDKKMPTCFNDILEPWGGIIVEAFGCPQYVATHKSDNSLGYIFVPWSCKLEDIPENAPLIYDKSFLTHSGGVNVLMTNGKVVFIKDLQYFLKFKKTNEKVIIPSGK